jgi:hypothetical protein
MPSSSYAANASGSSSTDPPNAPILAVLGAPNQAVFHASAWRAVSLSIRGPNAATRTGMCRDGSGSSTASRVAKYSPSNVTVWPRSNGTTIPSASSNRSTRWSLGNPNASYSASCHPAPRPRISRPPLTSPAVAAILATAEGCRKLEHRTSVPISTRSVAAARALTTVHASSCPSIGPLDGLWKKWSNIQTESRPCASAARANDAIARHDGLPPSESLAAAGTITPTFIRGVYEGSRCPVRCA